MQDWKNDGTLKVQEGQIIAPEVLWELVGSVPPTTWGNGVFQMGEADSHRNGIALYKTFERVDNKNHYKYVGLKPAC